jgi:hypothetical protein
MIDEISLDKKYSSHEVSRQEQSIAWPLLIVGSMVLGVVEHFHWDSAVNTLFSPLTWLLGLPAAVGTTNVISVMTPAQII